MTLSLQKDEEWIMALRPSRLQGLSIPGSVLRD